jgi:hypothetical protein
MRAGGAYHRIKFFAKSVTRDDYGAASEAYNYSIATITTRGEVRYTGGTKTLANEEKFYSKSVELIVRYRSTIVETMHIQIDGTNDLWQITYMEMLGRNESIRMTIEKLSDGLTNTIVYPPTGFTATLDEQVAIDLAWTNNAGDEFGMTVANDGIVIERSLNGNTFTEVVRIPKAVSPALPVVTYKDEDLAESTLYFYRARAFNYNNYSTYTTVDTATTATIIP